MQQILTGLNKQVAKQLVDGGVGVIPTDTVYGLVCRAADEPAVARLYALKNRQAKPGTVIASTIDQLVEMGLKRRYLTPLQHYWPNPVSIVIPNHELAYLHHGLGSLAVRIPKHPELQEILQISGPLLTTSVNLPGQPEAVTIQMAQNYFGDKVDFYADGGDLTGKLPSTLIRVVDDMVEVLRDGAVKIDEAGRII